MKEKDIYGNEIVVSEELKQAIEELKTLNDDEILAQYEYYEPKAKRLGKEEYKYLIAIKRELNMRRI